MNPAQSQPPQANPLDQLKDIHLPDAIVWWPPALGWWLVAIISLSLITLLTIFISRYWIKTRYKRHAIKQLNHIIAQQNSYQDDVHALSELLRQTAIAAEIPAVKKMHGEQWQQLLQTHMPEQDAYFFAIGRYQQPQPENQSTEQLHSAVASWIKKHKTGAAY